MTTPNEGNEIVAEENSASETGDGLEERLRRLETIVTALDSDALELEQALALFEEGVGHVRTAREILTLAELKVEELIGTQGEEQRPMDTGTDRVDE